MPTAISEMPVTIPPDVASFATEKGVAAYLEPVVRMVQGIFGDRPLSLRVDIDPEDLDLQRVLIGVTVDEFDTEQYLHWRHQWATGIFDQCPATHVHFFLLDIDPA